MSIGMLKGLQQLLEVRLDLEARLELDVVITSWSSLFQNCWARLGDANQTSTKSNHRMIQMDRVTPLGSTVGSSCICNEGLKKSNAAS